MKNLIALIAILFIFTSCVQGSDGQYKTIKQQIFENIRKIVVFKDTDEEYLVSIISPEDLLTIKRELDTVSIKKIRINSSKFFPGYHLLYFYLNNSKRSIPMLYSIDLKLAMIRDCDIFKEEPKITYPLVIYQFNIPESIIKIIRKYEQKLLNKGKFIDDWPMYLNLF